MKKFIANLGVVFTISDSILFLCDKNGMIVQEKETRSHQKSKHILRRFHLIRKIIAKVDVVVERASLIDNIIDLLTKPLAKFFFRVITQLWG